VHYLTAEVAEIEETGAGIAFKIETNDSTAELKLSGYACTFPT
jgi:hypothetical protein